MNKYFIYLIIIVFINISSGPFGIAKDNINDKNFAKGSEAEAKYLLANDLMEKAFDDIDLYSHLVSDQEAFALAIENLIESCKLNYPKACSDIGEIYANGNDLLKVDPQKGIIFLEKAIKLGEYTNAVTLLHIYYSHREYDKIFNLANFILKSKHFGEVHNKERIFYYLEFIYKNHDSKFLNYTKAYACCYLEQQLSNIKNFKLCDDSLSKLPIDKINEAKQIINNWLMRNIWD